MSMSPASPSSGHMRTSSSGIAAANAWRQPSAPLNEGTNRSAMASSSGFPQRQQYRMTRGGVSVFAGSFGDNVDYAQLVKIYGKTGSETGMRRYSPPECIGCEQKAIYGDPDPKHISTSFAERSNLTMRMNMRRFTQLTNAFSKKVENHAHAVALHMMYYNFVRIHKTPKITPAMAAGVTKRLWEMKDVVEMLEAWETSQSQRGGIGGVTSRGYWRWQITRFSGWKQSSMNCGCYAIHRGPTKIVIVPDRITPATIAPVLTLSTVVSSDPNFLLCSPTSSIKRSSLVPTFLIGPTRI